MNLTELQQQTEAWRDTNFPGWTQEDQLMGVVEEVGELAHHILKRKQGIRGTPEYHHVEIRDACADIIIYLTGVATREGFDLGHVVEQVWERVSVRDWVSNPETGDGIKDGWPSS